MIRYMYTSNIDLATIEHLAKEMPEKRLSDYQQLAKVGDKVNNIVSFLLLKQYCQENGYETEITYGNDGKPYIQNNPFFFNISHSDGIVAVAFDNDEVGMDIEKIKDVDQDIAGILYSDIEKEKYSTLLTESKTFYKAWVMKESYTKMLGKGLYIEFKDLTLNLEEDNSTINEYNINSYIIDDYFLAITTKKSEINIEKIELDELLRRIQ